MCVCPTNSNTCAGGRFYRTATALHRILCARTGTGTGYRSPHTTIIHNHAFTAFLNMSVSAHFQNSLGPVKTCGPTYLMCRRSAQFRVCESGGSRRSSRI